MGKSKDKRPKRETEDKNLALGVKKKQLKRKDISLNRTVKADTTVNNDAKEDKELAKRKKLALMKEKKKNRHAKVKSTHVIADNEVELPSGSKDDAMPKLKKKTKKKAMEVELPSGSKDDATPKLEKKTKKKAAGSSNPVKVNESTFVSDDAETPKLKKKKRKVKEGKNTAGLNGREEIPRENQDEETQRADVNQFAAESEEMDNGDSEKTNRGKKIKTKKVKKSGKAKKIDKHAATVENMERHVEGTTANIDGTADADEIPSVDEDCSRGMKKWILEYKQKRPGLKILQERIDEFIVAHEEQQEEERKEREARAAEEGWTVVVHHKGRKKTTDAETGTAVGSVSLTAMQEKMANKKPKEVAPNFYRFQKREAHLSELAKLQSKFEQDKKRIQELRAQRKFKPY